jgi:hypothetical protein
LPCIAPAGWARRVGAQPLLDAMLVKHVAARRQLPRRQPIVPDLAEADHALTVIVAPDSSGAVIIGGRNLLELGDGDGRKLDAVGLLVPILQAMVAGNPLQQRFHLLAIILDSDQAKEESGCEHEKSGQHTDDKDEAVTPIARQEAGDGQKGDRDSGGEEGGHLEDHEATEAVRSVPAGHGWRAGHT